MWCVLVAQSCIENLDQNKRLFVFRVCLWCWVCLGVCSHVVSHVLRRASHTHTHTHMKRQIGRLIGCGTRLYMHMHACTYTCIRTQVGEHVLEVDGVS